MLVTFSQSQRVMTNAKMTGPGLFCNSSEIFGVTYNINKFHKYQANNEGAKLDFRYLVTITAKF